MSKMAWILHLASRLSTKSKTHTWWGNRCFRGPILYRIKVVPSNYLSPLQNQDLIDLKKNGLMELILLHNQEPEFYTWHLSTNSKAHTCWEKGVSGELSFTESRSFPLTISHHYRIKIWRYDIDEHALTTKSKTLGHHQPYFSKISSLPKM